jgi:SAM-dependent methyltransferase
MTHSAATYDELPYEGYAYWFTHPDHLWVMAHARGLDAPSPATARILELGCGDGGNLLSLATALPDASLVGVDLSEVHITRGNALIAETGLTHVRLIQGDLLALSPDLGTFDYILAHGVYSWVPAPVRDALLAAISKHLAPNGVALVSYNTYPGQHDLEPLRGLMRLHTAQLADPQAKVRQARAIARTWCEHMAQHEGDTRGAVAKRLLDLLERTSDQMIRHDWLAEHETPILFEDFVAHARRFELDYLDNALPASQRIENCDDEARDLLAKLPASVRQQQYLDLFENTRFRVTLLAHAAALTSRPVPTGPTEAGFDLERMADLHVESRIDIDVWSTESRFKPFVLLETPTGFIEVSGAPLRIALSTLYHHAPAAIPVRALFTEVLDQLVAEHQDGGLAETEEGRARLFGMLVRQLVSFWTRELVHFWADPPTLANPRRLPDPPRTSPLQRALATRTRFIPTLTHRHSELDAPRLELLAALDGQTTRADLETRYGTQRAEALLEALARQGLLHP